MKSKEKQIVPVMKVIQNKRPSKKRPCRDKARGQHGFTMVELLIVMGISLFGLAGLMSVYTTASRSNVSVGHSATAIDICEQTMEGFRSMSIADIEAVASYGPIDSTGWGPFPHHLGDASGRNGIIFNRNIEAIEVFNHSNLVRLKVTIEWADNGKQPNTQPATSRHQISLEMVRTRQELL